MKTLLVALVATGCLLGASSASAATEFGPDLNALTADELCPGCTSVTLTRSDGTTETGSPTSGVLTKVAVRYKSPAADAVVSVMRPAATPAAFLGVDRSIVALPAVTQDGGSVVSVPVRLRIAAGDRLGFGIDAGDQFPFYLHNDPHAQCANSGFGAGDGQFDPGACGAREVLIRGTVEPDADGDGFGDETQDQCPAGGAVPGGACPVPEKKKCKRKKAKKRSAETAKKKTCKRKKRKK